jgi:hypothetical protein
MGKRKAQQGQLPGQGIRQAKLSYAPRLEGDSLNREARRLAKLFASASEANPWHPRVTDIYRFAIDRVTEFAIPKSKIDRHKIQMLSWGIGLKTQEAINELLEAALRKGAEIAVRETMLVEEDVKAYNWKKEIEGV